MVTSRSITAVLILFIALSSGTAVSVNGGNARAGKSLGKMHFPKMSHNFGKVRRGEKLTYRFEFTNLGGGPLTFQGVHASCGCMVADFAANQVYQPGEVGSIAVSFDSTNFRGKVEKTVTVMPSESQFSAVNLNVQAFVTEELYADPPIVLLGDVNSVSKNSAQVKIKSVDGFPVLVRDVKYNKENFEVSFQRDGNDWLVSIGLKDNLHSGFFRDTISVINNSTALPELPILVRANILGTIAHSPSYLEFGAIDKNKSSDREIVLQQTGEHSITTSRVELNVNGDKIENVEDLIEIQPETVKTSSGTAEKRRVKVILKNQGGKTNYGSVHGRIVFHTSDPKQEQLPIDFYAFFL